MRTGLLIILSSLAQLVLQSGELLLVSLGFLCNTNVADMCGFFHPPQAPRAKLELQMFRHVPAVICWSIWKEKDGVVFRGAKTCVESICSRTLAFLYSWSEHLDKAPQHAFLLNLNLFRGI